MEHIRQLQAQLQQSQETIAQQREFYEAQVRRQAEELSRSHAAYQKQLRKQAEQLRQRVEQLVGVMSKLSKTQKELSRIEEELSVARMQISIFEPQLLKSEELLRQIYSSSSWQIASRLRHLRQRVFQFQELQHKVLRRLPLLPQPIFHGALDVPVKGSRAGEYLDVAGWVFSRAAPIARVEASVDGLPLGALSYGLERADIAARYTSTAPPGCGYAGRFSLGGVQNGSSILVVRVWDEPGNQHYFTCSLVIDVPATSSLKLSPAVVVDISPPQQPVKATETSTITETSARADVMDNDLYLQLKKLIVKFETERGHEPSILNWNVDANLPGAFPHLAVFSPPASNRKAGLPYIDRSIDIVMLASDDASDLAEARRVATAAVINVNRQEPEQPSSETAASLINLDVEWQETRMDTTPSSGVSIIIPVYNKVDYTKNCLEQLAKTLPDSFVGEIIVVDDASTDDTPVVLSRRAAQDRRIKVLRNPQNVGFIGSCNRGAEAASQEILVFLNNDTLPQPGWLQPLLRVLSDHPDAGAVGGKLIYPDGTLQEAGGVIFSDGYGCNFGRNDRSANAPLYSFLREVDYCSGALLATPRALFMEIGGFDTRFAPAYYEDTDYCFSLREKGYRVYYQPESVIVHFEGVSSGTDLSSGIKSYQAVNRISFLDKWKHVLQYQPPAPDQYDFATLQALSVRQGSNSGSSVSESDEN